MGNLNLTVQLCRPSRKQSGRLTSRGAIERQTRCLKFRDCIAHSLCCLRFWFMYGLLGSLLYYRLVAADIETVRGFLCLTKRFISLVFDEFTSFRHVDDHVNICQVVTSRKSR